MDRKQGSGLGLTAASHERIFFCDDRNVLKLNYGDCTLYKSNKTQRYVCLKTNISDLCKLYLNTIDKNSYALLLKNHRNDVVPYQCTYQETQCLRVSLLVMFSLISVFPLFHL